MSGAPSPAPSARPGADRTARHRLAALGLVLLLVLLAAATRSASFPHARREGRWILVDGDSYYHLRRVEQTIAAGGRVPMFDPWLSFPGGQRIQWHAGLDLPLAALGAAVCGTAPTRDCLTSTAALAIPVLGILAVLVVLLLGRAAAGPRAGYFAALLFALYPFCAGPAALGHVDHHALEPLCVALWCLLLARGRPAGAGLVAGLSFAVFPSALWPVAATLAGLSVERFLLGSGGRTALRFALATLAAAVPVILTGAFPDRIEPSSTSWFHGLVLGCAALALGLAEAVLARFGRPLLAALAGGAVVLGAALLGAKTVGTLLSFARSSGLWADTVHHQPLVRGAAAWLLVTLLVIGACLASAIISHRRGRPAMRWLALTALPLGLGGILQLRLLVPASGILVVVLADAWWGLGEALHRRLAREPRRTRIAGRIVTLAVAALLLMPTLEYRRLSSPGAWMRPGIRLLERLGRRVDGDEPRAVLADWAFGHHVLYFAGRPTVASPFIFTGLDAANAEARRALYAATPEELYAIMSRRRARYLLVTRGLDPALAARSVGLALAPHAAAVALLDERARRWTRLRELDSDRGARLFELVQR